MRRRLLAPILAGLAAIIMAVPLWAALTSERNMLRSPGVAATIRVTRPQLSAPPLAEAATLVLTGGVLLGLASAVRRTS
jgi:hypothetical protein